MMTNYPAECAPSWREFPLLTALALLRDAIRFADWDPRKWAANHNICVDLPSAWWLACHVLEDRQYEKRRCDN